MYLKLLRMENIWNKFEDPLPVSCILHQLWLSLVLKSQLFCLDLPVVTRIEMKKISSPLARFIKWVLPSDFWSIKINYTNWNLFHKKSHFDKPKRCLPSWPMLLKSSNPAPAKTKGHILNYRQGLEIHVHVVVEKFILEYRTNFKIKTWRSLYCVNPQISCEQSFLTKASCISLLFLFICALCWRIRTRLKNNHQNMIETSSLHITQNCKTVRLNPVPCFQYLKFWKLRLTECLTY